MAISAIVQSAFSWSPEISRGECEIEQELFLCRAYLWRMYFLFFTCAVYIFAQGVQWVYQRLVCSETAVWSSYRMGWWQERLSNRHKELCGAKMERLRSFYFILTENELFKEKQIRDIYIFLIILFMDRISRRSHGVGRIRFGDHRIGSLLFADDVVLLFFLHRDL